jgi:hypothetical protein
MRIAFVVAALSLGAVAQDDIVRKVVPDADKVKKLVKKISPPSRDKIEKALGEKLDPPDLTPALWECYAIVPKISTSEKTRCVVTSVTVKGPKGTVRVGVAVATLDKTIHLVKVLDNQDERALETRGFLSQFDGFVYTGESLYAPPVTLTENLKKAQGGDDGAKETDALVRINSTMRAMGPSWQRMMDRIDKKDKAAAEEADLLDKHLEETLKLLPAAKFFKASKADKFKGFASGGRTDLGDLKKLLEAGKFEDGFRRAGQIDSDRCAKCHASYRNEFGTEREKRGLGDGYFSTKLEVGMPDPKLEASYQAAASGIRKAILLATEAK